VTVREGVLMTPMATRCVQWPTGEDRRRSEVVVDRRTRREVVHLFGDRHGDGMAIVIATHDMNGLAAHLPEVTFLNRRLLARGTRGEVRIPRTVGVHGTPSTKADAALVGKVLGVTAAVVVPLQPCMLIQSFTPMQHWRPQSVRSADRRDDRQLLPRRSGEAHDRAAELRRYLRRRDGRHLLAMGDAGTIARTSRRAPNWSRSC